MSENNSLQELILGYCRQVGGLVEPPAYGIHEVLLPDEIAARWGLDPIQRFIFSTAAESKAGTGSEAPDITYINYSHPLVETIVEELRRQTANGHFFINNLRLEKPGLYAACEKALVLSNAKLFPLYGAVERKRLYHIVRFNFKASLISDEKRELVLPVWMSLQGGHAVNGAEIERLAILDTQTQFEHLDPAEAVFTTQKWAPTSPELLGALLERARQAALIELAPNLDGLQNRLQRFLELDRARLVEYYDDLIKAAEKRLRSAEEDRRPALEAKLAAIQTERQAKLADVEQKYRLRVELELVNLALIAQPKLDLMIEIKKRTAAVQRRVIWDPLQHWVEPLICDVCGQPGNDLHLCDEGHLAHAGCLAPQCVKCKRTYCRLCADKVQHCVVCDQPLCIHSLVTCPQCQRVTCPEHVNECHAAEGAPRRLQTLAKPTPAESPAQPTAPKAQSGPSQKAAPKKTGPKTKFTTIKAIAAAQPVISGDYLAVYADPAEGTITAYVIAKKREIAMRRWEIGDEGISAECHCHQGWDCEHNHIVYRPAPDNQLDAQMIKLITNLRTEYHVGVTKVRYYQIRQEQPFEERKLKLPPQWRDKDKVAQARRAYEALAARNSRR